MNTLLAARTWEDVERCLTELYALPSYAAARPLGTAAEAAKRTRMMIQGGGLGAQPRPREFVGPKRFFRAVGPRNRAFGGEWWFEEEQLLHLEQTMSRILFGAERLQAIRAALREVTAVTVEWNPFDELWSLDLPPGERLVGLVSRAAPQPYRERSSPADPARRQLVGHAVQIFFPVKNPLWVHHHMGLT